MAPFFLSIWRNPLGGWSRCGFSRWIKRWQDEDAEEGQLQRPEDETDEKLIFPKNQIRKKLHIQKT